MANHADTFLQVRQASASRLVSTRELHRYGERYGIDYHFPTLTRRRYHTQGRDIVLRGQVREFTLGPGMQLVASDIDVLQRYDSCSRAPSPLSIIVMLEGRAEITLGGQRLTLAAGMALSVQLASTPGIEAVQLPGQRLRALTLSLDEARLMQLSELAVPASLASRMQAWQIPSHLRQGLEQALSASLAPATRRLLLEGVCLQLLGHGLAELSADSPRESVLGPGERQRLERVRKALESAPTVQHRLEDLAGLAAMSGASLRRKFKIAYGCPVFDYLRQCRLSLAHEYLRQGHSVQQAAHFCGYHHASNFATAFRRHYGYAPSALGTSSLDSAG